MRNALTVIAFILGVTGFVLVAIWDNLIVATGVFLMVWGLKHGGDA